MKTKQQQTIHNNQKVEHIAQIQQQRNHLNQHYKTSKNRKQIATIKNHKTTRIGSKYQTMCPTQQTTAITTINANI